MLNFNISIEKLIKIENYTFIWFILPIILKTIMREMNITLIEWFDKWTSQSQMVLSHVKEVLVLKLRKKSSENNDNTYAHLLRIFRYPRADICFCILANNLSSRKWLNGKSTSNAEYASYAMDPSIFNGRNNIFHRDGAKSRSFPIVRVRYLHSEINTKYC